MRFRTGIKSLVIVLTLAMAGCHAAEDDPIGQAEELEDPVRRENAIFNLTKIYGKVLADHAGDRTHAEVKAIADAIVPSLSSTYVDNRTDTRNGLAILELLKEVRDARSLPALIAALDWRTEVTEDHAIRAAQTIQSIDIAGDKKGEVIKALEASLEKITGAREKDHQMRVAMIRALGSLHDKRAAPILVEIASRHDEAQKFSINRLAAQQIGELGDPGVVNDLVKLLFAFAPLDPSQRMNDVAAEALVRIGRPSLAPLLKVFRGENGKCNRLANAYIQTLTRKFPGVSKDLNVRQVTAREAGAALGALGMRQALQPLLKESQVSDETRRMNAAVALLRLSVSPAEQEQVRDAVLRVYRSMSKGFASVNKRVQLLAALAHTYDAKTMSLFLTEASNRRLHPDIRLVAAQMYALLSTAEESKAFQRLISKEPKSAQGGYREKFEAHRPLLNTAEQCDQKLGCWQAKLKGTNAQISRKAAYMLGRLGRGNTAAIDALTSALENSDVSVRLAALLALDRVATKGSSQAVATIDALREREQGRSSWTRMRVHALPIQARLRSRAAR